MSIHSEKERHHAELEALATTANNSLQKADAMLASLKAQAKAKKEELKGTRCLVGSMICSLISSCSSGQEVEE